MKVDRIARRSALLATVAFSVVATPVLAQNAEEEANPNDIIVTANKREENLQQVPISISAISAEQADLQGLTEIKNISAIAPNVTVLGGTTNATAAVVSIRGVPTPADETQGFDSPIGLYLDGVYLARSSTSSFEVADIERIEVLRGPQGTLFGRNTTGGAVNFITREPGNEAAFKLRLGYGNYDQMLGRVSIDTGEIAEGLRMTMTGLYKRRDGVVDNLLQPNERLDPGSNETFGFRWATVYEPNDSFKFTNIFDYTRTKGVPLPQQLAAAGNGLPNPPVLAGFNNVVPAPIAQYLAQSSIVEPGCGKTPSLTRVDPICMEAALPSTDKVFGNMARLEFSFGDMTLRSTTAYRQWHNRIEGSDLDGLGTIRGAALGPSSTTLNGFPSATLQAALGLPLANANFLASQPVFSANLSLFQATNRRNQKQFSQELELVSDSDGPFNWVLGAFYFKESGDEFNQQNFGFILDTNQTVYTVANFGPGAPLLQAANPARYRASLQSTGFGYRASGRSTAVYGQAEYRPDGRDGALGITVGLRYTWDHKTMQVYQNGATPFATTALIALNTNAASFSDWTGHVTLDYRMSDDVNLFARAARGYRSGGFNARQPTNLAANLGLLPFNNEVIWSYEVGFKAEIGSMLRLNASAFLNNYSDLQLAVPIPITGGGSFGTKVDNAGKVRYTGFEIEAQLRPTENFWFDANVGYTHKDFREYLTLNAANAQADISSVVRPSYSPDWTAAMAANARFDVGGGARATARIGWTYSGEYYQFGNPITAPFSEQTKGDARGLWDAQLRIDGISLGGSGEFSLTLWGKNLTDKEYVMRSVDFGQLGFAGTIYGEPRTFGVTVDFGF